MQPKPTTRVVTKSWTARKLLREMEQPENRGYSLTLALVAALAIAIVMAAKWLPLR